MNYDTNFLFDQAQYKIPYLLINLDPTQHQDHVQISKKSKQLSIDDDSLYRRKMYCQGYPSIQVLGTERPNWGVSYDFKAENGKWGHLVYELEPITNTPPYLSHLKFYVKYNNNESNYLL